MQPCCPNTSASEQQGPGPQRCSRTYLPAAWEKPRGNYQGGPCSGAGLGPFGPTGRAHAGQGHAAGPSQTQPCCQPAHPTPLDDGVLSLLPAPRPSTTLTLGEYLGLEALAEDEVLQVVEGLSGGLRDRTGRRTPGPALPGPKGYGEGADEERGAQQPALDGQPLGGGQLPAVHLHPGEEQQREQGGERQGGARAYG